MKRWLLCLLAILLLQGWALAEAGDGSIGEMTVVNCEEWVSLRAEPSVGSTRLAKVPLGATVESCSQYSEAFVYGCYEGQWGYILAQYLEPIAFENGGGYMGDMIVYNCEDWAPLCAEPNVDAEQLGQIPWGEIVTDCAWYTGDFIYGCYEGTYGYIPGEYLTLKGGKAEDAEQRQRAIPIEGEEEMVTETRYHSAMGFSIWYDEASFVVNDASSESEESTFLLEGRFGLGYLEFLTPTASGAGGMDFLEQLPGQFDLTDIGEIEMGATEDGVAYGWRSGYRDELAYTFYLVMDEEHEAQVIAVMPREMLEGLGRRGHMVVESISFE